MNDSEIVVEYKHTSIWHSRITVSISPPGMGSLTTTQYIDNKTLADPLKYFVDVRNRLKTSTDEYTMLEYREALDRRNSVKHMLSTSIAEQILRALEENEEFLKG